MQYNIQKASCEENMLARRSRFARLNPFPKAVCHLALLAKAGYRIHQQMINENH
jgi:hypothetical protein